MSVAAEVFETALDLGPEGLAQFAGGLDPEWIEEALAATGTASVRRRKIPSEQVIWLVLGMAMFADRSIRAVVDHLHLVMPGVDKLAPSAIPKARYRVGAEPVEWLFHRTVEAWRGAPGLDGRWGLELYAVDGTCLRVPDSDENFEHFGKPGGRNGPSDAGYPQARVACLMNLGTRLIHAAEFGPFGRDEHSLAASLWNHVPDDSLTILDRGFVNFPVFADLVGSGSNRHLLVRMRRNLKVHELQELDDGSVLAELRPDRRYKNSGLELPDAIRGRVIAYQFPDGEPSRLFTTLLDPQAHPADELIELYHERWEIELAYDELKTHMLNRREALRSKRPDGVAQEIWGTLLLYNLVRREMLDVAHHNELPPKRVSFWSSLLWMRNFWENQAWRSRPGTIPKSLAEFRSNLTTLINPPRRSARRFPRHVKIKMSNYKRNRGRRKPIDEPQEILK